MIHFFNPGHETALLNGSPYYREPENVRKLREDLAFLPAWYADPGDFVWVEKSTDPSFRKRIEQLNPDIHLLTPNGPGDLTELLWEEEVELWGITPQAIRYWEEYSERYRLSLRIPALHEGYRDLCSRSSAHKCLGFLCKEVPGIEKELIPELCSGIDEVEILNRNSSGRLLVKSPYSSSGRGLLWLEEKKLSRSSEQILRGMLRRQKSVSVERVLDKTTDFSMHFKGDRFIGYSLFSTNRKGAYERSFLYSQNAIHSILTASIAPELLEEVKESLIRFICKEILYSYDGYIGIDMMLYKGKNGIRLHPCVEINLRKSMGYLSIRLFEKYIHPRSSGYFSIAYHPGEISTNSSFRKEEGRIKEGSFSLCPVGNGTKYHATIYVSDNQRSSSDYPC